MAASDLHSTSSSLDLSFEKLEISEKLNLDISSPAEKLQVRSAYDCSSSSSDDDYDAEEARKSPFLVFYMREDDGSSTHRLGLEGASSDADCSESPASPRNVTLSKRETLLSEAWEQKRRLMLQEELSNLKDRARPELLGRSASCVKPLTNTSNLLNLGSLDRSASDCGNPNSRVWGKRTRSLTDHDFEELKGCLDLGFRFDESSIPDLCDTLPALEVYCAVTQNLQGSPCSPSPASSAAGSPAQSSTTPSWTIASPGDDTEDIKEKLKLWAQAVACTTRLCY